MLTVIILLLYAGLILLIQSLHFADFYININEGFLIKPIEIDELRNKIDSIIKTNHPYNIFWLEYWPRIILLNTLD